jgi:nucleoside-diphosphate-sugar epimerase
VRIFVAGAIGVIGVRLVPLLVAAGHEVAGMTRSAGKADALRGGLGGEPVVCDVYDAAALNEAVARFRRDAVMDQLTDLRDEADIPALGARNDRMRREGTRNLLADARAAGAGRIYAQSIAWKLPGERGVAVAEHERAVLDAGGVVIRYGQLYGPDTYYQAENRASTLTRPRVGPCQSSRSPRGSSKWSRTEKRL